MSFDLESHTTHHLTCWVLPNELGYHAISDISPPLSLMYLTKSSLADVQSPMTDFRVMNFG